MDSTQKALADQYKAALKDIKGKLESLEEALCDVVTFNTEVMAPIINKLPEAQITPKMVYDVTMEFQNEEWYQMAAHISKHLTDMVVIYEP